jgi:hypothetical protein
MHPLRSRRRAAAARIGLLWTLAVVLAACGTPRPGDATGGEEPAPTTSAASSSPTDGQLLSAPQDLTPGVRYLHDRFRVPYVFTPPDPGGVGGVWHGGGGGQRAGEPFSGVSLDNAPGYPWVSLHAPERVYDPRRPTQLVPAPRDQQGWVRWLQRHPYLRARQLGPVTVGGVRGVQLETAKVSHNSAPASFCAPLPSCVPFHEFGTGGPGGPVGFLKGDRIRWIALQVQGTPLVIEYGTSTKHFRAFAPVAKRLLASVEFRPTR